MIQQQPIQQPPVLSGQAYQMATTYNLGTPTVEYRPKFTASKAITTGILLLIALSCFVYSFASSSAEWILIGVIFLVLGLIIPVTMLPHRDTRVYVCTAGLLHQRGEKIDVIRWDQVEAVWQRVVRRYSYGIHTGTTHLYTVRRNDGTTFKFGDQLYNVEALGNTIARESTRQLLPGFIGAYQSGQTVNFGQIRLNQQGVSNGKELLPWYQIKGIQVNRGVISIQKEGKRLNWQTIQASQTPNVNVFMALVDYIVSGGKR